MDKMLDFEIYIISKTLEGNIPELSLLAQQLDSLIVVERVRKYHGYSIELKPADEKVRLIDGRYANINIRDTQLYIEEAECILYVDLTVMGGYVRFFRIGGKYHFENPFKVKEVFWEKLGKPIYSASERDFKTAIGYMATYT